MIPNKSKLSKLSKEKQLLIKGLSELKIETSGDVIEKFIIFLQELKKWNRVYNLTAITNDEDIIIKHFLDSLLYLRFIPTGKWDICDIGSGAGFPGLPIAFIRVESNITLIEPSKKKAAFLKHIRRILFLDNVKIINSRIEDIKDIFFDIVVTRALFSVSELILKARHIIKKGGFFIMNKGPAFMDEIKEIPAGSKLDVVSVILPLTSIKRNIVKITEK